MTWLHLYYFTKIGLLWGHAKVETHRSNCFGPAEWQSTDDDDDDDERDFIASH